MRVLLPVGLLVLSAACSSQASTPTDASSDGAPSRPDAGNDAAAHDGGKPPPHADAGRDATHAETGNVDAGADATSTVDGGHDAGPVPRVPVTITGTTDTRFVTETGLFASVEMQLSGAPLATAMGRRLAGYSRDNPVPNLYVSIPDGGSTVDLVGFGTAIESFEYARQPANNLAFESGAGTSLLFGPILNPTSVTGSAALALMIPRVQHFANGSNASPLFVSAVDGTDPQNRLGWPGLWPTLLPYRSFDPTVNPVNTVGESCSTTVDDEPVSLGPVLNLDYECDFNSLHLPNRSTQIDATVTPGAAGWAGWEYAQWALDDLQSLHDTAGTRLASVPAGSLSTVGATGNTVVGTAANPSGPAPVAGAYLGVGPIQGFQAEELIDILDNGAELWLSQLTTTDGATLGGFGSVETALQYNYASPLRWFPGAVAVTETPDPSGYPQPTGYAISDAGSHLFDLLGLAGAYATAYALTDQGNASVGGAQPVVALFDGDPFPADNQVADGEATLHDRALGMLRVLVVDIDRLHVDPTSGILVDDVSFTGATPTRGQTISTSSVAYAIVALRAVRRALGSQLALYDNTSADTAVSGVTTVLDSASLPLTGAPGGATLISDRIDAMLKAEAQLLLQSLTTSDGHAFVGWNVQSGETVSTDDTLDAHTAAIRGLLSAYEATGDATYLTRAGAVFTRMDSVFFDPAGLVYMSAPVPQSSVAYTPMRFALLEAALREMYEVSGTATGQGALGTLLENRLARSIKLLLNGWDDLDADGLVDDPSECLTATSLPDAGADGGQGTLAHGGLQMAERALSGEIGSVCDSIDPATCVSAGFSVVRHYTADREHDCVPEISAVSLPSALANQVTFTLSP